MTSKEAFEFIFGQFGIHDAGIKIWEAAVKWERAECEAVAKRYRDRNTGIKKLAGESIANSIKRRTKKDQSTVEKGEGNV